MIRGTTPTFELTVEDTVDLTEASNVYATFRARNKTLTKTGEDLNITAHQVDVYFNQEESLSFLSGFIEVQLNWTYSNGSRACSNVVKISVGDNLLPEVLV